MQVASVGRALPENYYSQAELLDALKALWAPALFNLERLEQLHHNTLVGGRHLALPLQGYAEIDSFGAANQAFIRCALELGERATSAALLQAGLSARDIDHIFFVSSTGIATPSVDALLANRLGLRPDIKRTPIFGLGCVAGAAALSRARDVLLGRDGVALVLSVELCSLTLQRSDFSIANLISSGLFGDGAAAALVRSGGGNGQPQRGPEIIDTRSVFYPDTEQVMGWEITDGGLKVVLTGEVPLMVSRHLAADVDQFLGDHGLRRADLRSHVFHPGGPRVLEAFQEALELPAGAVELSWRSLATVGNLSSASVLFILQDTMEQRRPPPGSPGLLLSMGPGFCSELVLLRW